MNIKFLSRQAEKTSGGTENSIAWNGTEEEMKQLFDSEAVNALSDQGRLRSVRFFQESPHVWCCEKKYTVGTSGAVSADRPFTTYGKKSATLKGSMLSMPIESHPKYKACWNYFLAASPSISSIPSWWKTAKDTTLSSSNSQLYAWIKSPAEAPNDTNGRWHILTNPLKPGVETYDVAVYSVTETAKFRSSNAAGKFVSGRLNSIGSPDTVFGIAKGNWKCDDACVFYDGEAWFATLTWTLSGNENGWDKDLYN